jgi:hypothetical protein
MIEGSNEYFNCRIKDGTSSLIKDIIEKNIGKQIVENLLNLVV